MNPIRDLVIGMSPVGMAEPGARLLAKVYRGGGTAVLDLGDGRERALSALDRLVGSVPSLGVRVPLGCAASLDDIVARTGLRLGLLVLEFGCSKGLRRKGDSLVDENRSTRSDRARGSYRQVYVHPGNRGPFSDSTALAPVKEDR